MIKTAILQSNYIPWKGVFDMINQVDIFVFFEDVQFTKRDWRTRNKIVTGAGTKWITVPVKKSLRETMICDIEIFNEEDWQRKHYDIIKQNYIKTPFFKEYHWILEELYLKRKWTNLSEFNINMTKMICKILGIETKFINSKDLGALGSKDDKLIDICKKVGADYYLSGPAAKDYIVDEKFSENNISLEYIEYEYPEYQQNSNQFTHYVTILDLIFNCGSKAPYYIWGWREKVDRE